MRHFDVADLLPFFRKHRNSISVEFVWFLSVNYWYNTDKYGNIIIIIG